MDEETTTTIDPFIEFTEVDDIGAVGDIVTFLQNKHKTFRGIWEIAGIIKFEKYQSIFVELVKNELTDQLEKDIFIFSSKTEDRYIILDTSIYQIMNLSQQSQNLALQQ